MKTIFLPKKILSTCLVTALCLLPLSLYASMNHDATHSSDSSKAMEAHTGHAVQVPEVIKDEAEKPPHVAKDMDHSMPDSHDMADMEKEDVTETPGHSAHQESGTMDISGAMAEGGHSAEAHAQMVEQTPEELIASVGLDDKSSQKIALDAVFLTENGKKVRMDEMIKGPTIILPIFFYCPVVCPLLISSLAEGVAQIPYKEGVDYNIIALSFNDAETPEIAKNAKKNYLHLLPEDFDRDAWHFLTGTQENILKFTDSIGFRFKRTAPNTFVHPNGLAIVDENGTIIRYIYGSTFLGADMGMAISEAQTHTPGISIKRLISICFNYDSEGKEYIAIFFKVLATLTVVGLGLFFVLFLRRSGRSPRGPKRQIEDKSTPQDKKKS